MEPNPTVWFFLGMKLAFVLVALATRATDAKLLGGEQEEDNKFARAETAKETGIIGGASNKFTRAENAKATGVIGRESNKFTRKEEKYEGDKKEEAEEQYEEKKEETEYVPYQDCEVGPWEQWFGCDVNCGGGVQHRIKTVYKPQEGDGAPCGETVEERACNTQPCPVNCEFYLLVCML